MALYNVVYLHTHDLGRFIQPYGEAVATPCLMGLAREGTLFRHAYCAAPTCSPSRAALLTGVSPHVAGMTGLVNRGFGLNAPARQWHLAHFLAGQGYETVLAGVQHEAPPGAEAKIGYARTLAPLGEPGEARDVRLAAAAAHYLRERRGPGPFFLAFGMGGTHRPFPALDGSIPPDYVRPAPPFFDSAQNREDMARFLQAVTIVDRAVGMVLDALRTSGRDRDTIVFFTTDHGIAFPHMKCNLFDTGIGVSLILRFPGNPLAGHATDALVSHLDLYPTLCALTGLPAPAWLEGHSLLPLLRGETQAVRDEVCAEVTYHAAYEPMRGIRTSRHKLIALYDGLARPVPANIDDGPTKAFLLDAGLSAEPRAAEMLFDLWLDPLERVNRVDDPRYQAVREALASRLERWMTATADPLLAGPRVPRPDDAQVNARASLSPTLPEYE